MTTTKMETKVEKLMNMINKGSSTESILKAFKESEKKDSIKMREFVEKFVEIKKEESNKLLCFNDEDEFEINEFNNIVSKFS